VDVFDGVPISAASRLIRALVSFQYAKEDEEYGENLESNHFAYFNEVIFRQPKPLLRDNNKYYD